jgi:hypothetical protein
VELTSIVGVMLRAWSLTVLFRRASGADDGEMEIMETRHSRPVMKQSVKVDHDGIYGNRKDLQGSLDRHVAT